MLWVVSEANFRFPPDLRALRKQRERLIGSASGCLPSSDETLEARETRDEYAAVPHGGSEPIL